MAEKWCAFLLRYIGNVNPDTTSTVITTQLEVPKALAVYTNRVH